MSYVGGYLNPTLDLVAGRSDAAHGAKPSPAVIEALNTVQHTAWCVNTPVLSVMSDALARGDRLGELPAPDPMPVPGPANADGWARLDPEQYAELMAERAEVHHLNQERAKKFIRLHRVIGIAKKFEHYGELYFPHQIDFRGRYFPAPGELNPQGPSYVKALLRFAEPRRLTDAGEYWLHIGLANAAGKDKLSLEDRIAWTQQHRELILDSARDPVDGERFWSEMEEPWLFLALARDLAAGVTQVPVCIDATCSGIQHLSALTRDLDTGAAVNLCAGPRADLYQAVADAVAREVSNRALAGDSGATEWAGNITRSTVKSCVMTLPYGATTSGRRTQLMEHAAQVSPKPYAAARWLCSVLEEVLHSRLVGPMRTLAYFTQIAKVLARANRPVCWTTPSGLQVRQRYNASDAVRVNTLAGRLQYRRPRPEKADVMRTGHATAPNVVHSLDAAHLTAIVLAWGGPLQVIHDSVGTYANDVGRLAEIARTTFAEMYSEPVLHDWHAQQVQQHPDLADQFLEPPELGAWEPGMVRTSTYFFS